MFCFWLSSFHSLGNISCRLKGTYIGAHTVQTYVSDFGKSKTENDIVHVDSLGQPFVFHTLVTFMCPSVEMTWVSIQGSSLTFSSFKTTNFRSIQKIYLLVNSLHSMARANMNKSEKLVTNTTTASKYTPKRPGICINWNPPFQTSLHKIYKSCFMK